MSKGLLEKLAAVLSFAIICGGLYFWWLQVLDVLELLQMAYG